MRSGNLSESYAGITLNSDFLMKIIPQFLVLTSLNEEEDAPKNACHIVLETQDNLTEFADYLEQNTLLSVYSVRRLDRFFCTIGTFYHCGVLEVHLKEEMESAGYSITSEQVAIAETYSYLHRTANQQP